MVEGTFAIIIYHDKSSHPTLDGHTNKCNNFRMSRKFSLTAQNRLIISGLLLSTALIVFIAIFAVFNIQKMLKQGYQSFGEGISRTLAIESIEQIKNLSTADAVKSLKSHSELLLAGHNDIVLIEYRDNEGNILYSTKNISDNKVKKPAITVSSPLIIPGSNDVYGSVTVGLSGNVVSKITSTARISLLFVFTVVWFVFALVILINTYLITRELKMLQSGVKKISTGQFGYKLESGEVSSEVQELFKAFNDMSNRLHIYEEQNIDRIMLERNKFESVLMSIANGVVVCDDNDNVVLINNHAQDLLEVTEEQLLNTKIQNYIDTSENYCFKAKIEEFKDTPLDIIEKKPIEFTINVDNRVIKSVMSPMFTGNRDYVGYIIVLIDMTKEAEMDKMRSDFISNVSHELRTPVTVLRSYIDTLYNYGNEFDYDTQKEFIGTINQEIIRLQSMVNDILDFSRMESNAPMEKSLNNILEVVEDCVRQVSILAKDRQIKISVSKDDDIPDFMFNYNGIQRALTNFLSNAIKYSPDDSTIDINIRNLRDTNEVEVTVTDRGCGIAPEHLKKIFDRFYRVENNVHSVKGTGLGLHLVKTTIEKYHNGRIYVNSEVGKGSTFGFILPAGIETDAEKVI